MEDGEEEEGEEVLLEITKKPCICQETKEDLCKGMHLVRKERPLR